MNTAIAAYNDAQEQQSKSVEIQLLQYSNSRILIAEDSPTVRSQIARYLMLYGLMQIKFAVNGQEALETAKSWRPDLVLTDLHMPVMDGAEFCRQMRANSDLRDIPILVLTGAEKQEERAAVFEAGATDLIRKPVYHIELVGRLQVHLDRSRLIKSLTEYKERVVLELELAKTMQVGMLPDQALISEVLETYPVDMASHYQPSIGLGGDLWGMKPIDPDRLFVYVLDFSGHGVGAAINTFRFQTFYRSLHKIVGPAELMEKLNFFLKGVLPVGQFATMFCAVLDFKKGEMTFSSAGAPPALVKTDKTSGRFLSLDGTGFPLGLCSQAGYRNSTLKFPVGSSLFLYSDALVETPEPPNSIFDYAGLANFLNGSDDPHTCVKRVVGVLNKITEDNDDVLSDDVTVFCLTHLNRQIGSE